MIEYIFEIFLLLINILLGYIFSVILSNKIKNLLELPLKIFYIRLILLTIYFIECISVVMGMFSPVFSFFVAIVIGLIIGFSFRIENVKILRKTAFLLSLFMSIPMSTFLLVPVFCILKGEWDIFSTEAGYKFGIPEFLPFPMNTIAGFYPSLIILQFLINVIVIVGLVSLIKNALTVKSFK